MAVATAAHEASILQTPMAPGSRRPKRAPLPIIALVVGGTLCVLAIVAGMAPAMVATLAHDGLVMRALGLTLGFSGFMLARVALLAAAGPRRVLALVIAVPLVALALALLAYPQIATYLYDSGRGIFVPWVFGLPAVLALLLSRWRINR